MSSSSRYQGEQNSTLRNQLLQSHLRVAGLAAAVLLLIAFALQLLKTPITEIRLVNQPSANAASLVQLGLQRSEASLRSWVALGKPEFRDSVELAWQNEIRPAFESLRTLSDSDTADRQQLLLSLDKKLKRLKRLHNWTMEVSAKAGNEPAKHVFTQVYGASRKSLLDALTMYRKPLDHRGVAVSLSFFKLRLALSEAEAALGRFVVEGLEPDATIYQHRIKVVRQLIESSEVKLTDKEPVLKQLDVLENLSKSIIKSRRSPRSNIAWHTISTRVAPLSTDIAETFSTIADHELSTMREQVERIAMWSNALSICSLLALFIVVVLASVLSNTAARRISAPVTQLYRATKALQNGDYSQDLTPEGVREVHGLILAFNSMRKSISRSHRILEDMAYTDELTGLQNRKAFNHYISNLHAVTQRGHHLTGVMMIDFDRFKQLNDSLGHDAGDFVLSEFSRRLKEHLGPEDIAARIGGDEFAVILRSLSSKQDAIELVENISEVISQPLIYRGERLSPSATFGLAVESIHNMNSADLVKKADLALYDAKEKGRGTYCFYSSKIHNKAEKTRRLAELIEFNQPEDMFCMFYQPYVDLNTGDIVGTEALLRCIHPECTDIPILDIITMLERNGHIAPISVWIMEQAVSQLIIWQNTYFLDTGFTMSVNVSAALLRDGKFVQEVLDVVNTSGINGNSITIEITETTVMEDCSASVKAMRKLNDIGIEFAMDDFGTGYSSLVRLREMPLSLLKIDQVFVKGMLECTNDAAIVDASLQLGYAMGMLVTAEGIETAEQAEALRELGCARGQGYYFSYPKPAEEFEQLLPRLLRSA